MAKPDSPDPIARESTRLTYATGNSAETSLDPKQLRAEWMPNMRYGGHAFGFRKPAPNERDKRISAILYNHRDEVLTWIKEYSPPRTRRRGRSADLSRLPPRRISRLSLARKSKRPDALRRDGRPPWSSKLKAGRRGGPHLSYPDHKDPDYATINDFLISKLKVAKP